MTPSLDKVILNVIGLPIRLTRMYVLEQLQCKVFLGRSTPPASLFQGATHWRGAALELQLSTCAQVSHRRWGLNKSILLTDSEVVTGPSNYCSTMT
jgi:hypothetical protein